MNACNMLPHCQERCFIFVASGDRLGGRESSRFGNGRTQRPTKGSMHVEAFVVYSPKDPVPLCMRLELVRFPALRRIPSPWCEPQTAMPLGPRNSKHFCFEACGFTKVMKNPDDSVLSDPGADFASFCERRHPHVRK